MLDHRLLSKDPQDVLDRLARRGIEESVVGDLRALAEQRRQSVQAVDNLRHELNQASEALKQKAHQGDRAAIDASRERLRALKDDIKRSEDAQQALEERLQDLLRRVPNLPDASVPVGPDASFNRVERAWGSRPALAFAPKPHWEIGEALGILSFEQAARISGARFAVYRGAGARLERALINFMLDNARECGYEEVIPPLLVRREAMEAAGQFPKFEGESFETLEREYVLIPTSEVPLVNLHRGDILEEAELPRRYTAYTPCFRREAGAAGKDTRGLIRQHQFNKVELVAYTTPEASAAELERLTGNAEAVLQKLGLHYRVVSLCTGDLGFCSQKTYDLEVWLPGQGDFREISSCSNCGDFQARRGQIRYRPARDGQKAKPQLVHTLNGSGLAVGRTFVAILENYQEADGSVTIPAALRPYFGSERIAAA